jgi:hypothetical protein
MIIFKKILLLFLYSGALWAQHFDPGLLHLLATKPIAPNYSNAHCLVDANGNKEIILESHTELDLKECTYALCGNPMDNQSAILNDRNFQEYLTDDSRKIIKNLDPKLSLVLNKIRSDALVQVDQLEKSFYENGSLKLRPEAWSESFKRELSLEIFKPHFQVIVDLKKPIYERVQVQVNYPKDASEDFKKELKNFASAYETHLKMSGESSEEKGLYTREEKNSISVDRIAFCKKKYLEKKDSLSEGQRKKIEKSINDYDFWVLQEKTNSETLTNNFSPSYLMLIDLEKSMGDFVPELKNYAFAPECSDEKECLDIYKNYLTKKNILNKIKNFRAQINDPILLKHAKNTCRASFIAHELSKSDREKTIVLIEKVKKQMEANVFNKFSKHSQGILVDYINNKIVVNNMNIREGLMSGYSSDSNNEQDEKRMDDFLKREPMAVESNQEYFYKKLISSPEVEDSFEYDSSDYSCDAKTVLVWDAYASLEELTAVIDTETLKQIGNKDQIFVSSFSCQHDLRGQAIVAHELGHAISHIFNTIKLSESSTEFYKNFRKCATNNHKNLPENFINPSSGESAYTEEDTADLIAYMAYPNPKDLFSCTLLSTSLDGKLYDDLSLIQDEKKSIDIHSTSLLRVVQEAINKNIDLPYSCLKAIEPLKNKLGLKKCIP